MVGLLEEGLEGVEEEIAQIGGCVDLRGVDGWRI